MLNNMQKIKYQFGRCLDTLTFPEDENATAEDKMAGLFNGSLFLDFAAYVLSDVTNFISPERLNEEFERASNTSQGDLEGRKFLSEKGYKSKGTYPFTQKEFSKAKSVLENYPKLMVIMLALEITFQEYLNLIYSLKGEQNFRSYNLGESFNLSSEKKYANHMQGFAGANQSFARDYLSTLILHLDTDELDKGNVETAFATASTEIIRQRLIFSNMKKDGEEITKGTQCPARNPVVKLINLDVVSRQKQSVTDYAGRSGAALAYLWDHIDDDFVNKCNLDIRNFSL